jgi:hypothetical protein
MLFSAITIAVGAVMYWAVTSEGIGFRVSTATILMAVGTFGLLASAVLVHISSRRRALWVEGLAGEAEDANNSAAAGQPTACGS